MRVADLHVRYSVYADVKPTLRSLMATAGRRRRFSEVHAIKGVSFTAYSGEVIGIIGANGSGKSTLMRAVAGLLPASDGAVYAHSTPMLLGVGAVLNKMLSGRRNIVLGGLALGLRREEILERENDIVEFAGIGDAIDRPMKTYSSGMQARLQFAISAAVEPEILIIDEALSVGDADFQNKASERIGQLRDKAGTVFLVTHGMASVRKNCNRALWLEDGVIKADGAPVDVVAAYRGAKKGEQRAKEIDKQRSKKTKRRQRRMRRWEKRRAKMIAGLSERGIDPEVARQAVEDLWPRNRNPERSEADDEHAVEAPAAQDHPQTSG